MNQDDGSRLEGSKISREVLKALMIETSIGSVLAGLRDAIKELDNPAVGSWQPEESQWIQANKGIIHKMVELSGELAVLGAKFDP